MSCDRRLRTIRLWLLVAATTLAAWLYPTIGTLLLAGSSWLLLGLFIPVFPGDCGTINAACNAGTKPTTASVTLTGYASAVCGATHNCTERNSTFACTYSSDSVSSCSFKYNNFPCASDASGNNPLTVLIQNDATHTKVDVNTQCALGSRSTDWLESTSLSASPTDCLAFGTVTPALIDNSCDIIECTAPATVTVVFS